MVSALIVAFPDRAIVPFISITTESQLDGTPIGVQLAAVLKSPPPANAQVLVVTLPQPLVVWLADKGEVFKYFGPPEHELLL